ncbi:MAG: selenocysteine-specific translation elongation factor [Lachnospiraceae bacterium]|nr:selenocysteine-specific translation elongation factor [Lachnospiraceae bacterium]
MEHFIIGTSGHIDHGKTALIKALTGRDLDTGKEEKERGITIELGFTYFDLPDKTRAGIIDVPGHEKFLPNMLSGVCGMDLVLLVIALDEGVMPQTVEHMDILHELNVSSGIVVLTKCDMVELDFADLMEEEITEKLKGTVAEKWPKIRVSAVKNINIDKLISLICDAKKNIVRSHDTKGQFRLPVDRILSIKGLGTVLAGTVLEGNVHVDEELTIYPIGIKTKVKSIESHGETVNDANAGMRTALLLQGVKKEDIKRGMVIAVPGSIVPTTRIDVNLSLLKHVERSIKNQQRVHLHIGTDEVTARVVLLNKDVLMPGDEAYAELVLEREIAVRRGDRFVIRFLSPLETIGGGSIINANAVKKKRNDEKVIKQLDNQFNNKAKEALIHLIEEQNAPIKDSKLRTISEIAEDDFRTEMDEIIDNKEVFVLASKKENYYLSYETEDNIRNAIVSYIKSSLENRPYKSYENKLEIKNKFLKAFEPFAIDAYFERLVGDGLISIENDRVMLNGYEVTHDDTYERVLDRLLKEFKAHGTDFIGIKELKPQALSDTDYADLIESYCLEDRIVKINDDFYTTTEVAGEIEDKVIKFFEKEDIISFASLRDLLGTSRRSAKPVMAYLDNRGITAWSGKETERKKKA